jgi:quinol monooxygenase YgiN
VSVILAGTVRFDPAGLPAARERMKQMMRLSRAEDGCIEYVYSEDLIDPGLVHVFEIWRDEDALHAHHEAPHFLQWRADRDALGMSDRNMTAHSVTSSRKT